ncbi:AmmeMemoRadiSam system protein A [Desulfovibrio litoralis]|uniref:AMMECR1 domain-containing protein n=1 Tax=Desulfovibrio litoralis DSM 11393 TaxID=1121455 RepID=A0A1M7RVS3_9BACT|nr:AmmeMemoRadiSam system protein A [Desulfovibrio litoralis]SHN50208.1 hypothetical protein SAMN02745728_00216 [Desulfovibrio litoralis DSM 11393]
MFKTEELEFSQAEKQYLYKIAKESISQALNEPQKTINEIQTPKSKVLQQKLGAFVTLKKNHALRGCIGTLIGVEPLFVNVWKMARAAAFNDPRFRPLTSEELKDVEISITVMGEISPCPNPKDIELGKHGLIMRTKDGRKQGLLLPQVPIEQGWNLDTFLAQTCVKAGLPEAAWQNDNVEILWFEGIIL